MENCINLRRRFLSVCLIFALFFFLISITALQAAQWKIKMCYNGPPDAETNAVHQFAVNFKRYAEKRTDGRVEITLYANSQLGNEEQRMEQVMSGPLINVASYGGVAPVFPEMFAANIPFMFDSYEAAHWFFDKSKFWQKAKKEFKKRTNTELLEAVEEGGFLSFTNSKREIRSPKDFKGLRFRAMDESQIALYKSFGASGTPIPWTEVYMALKTGVADGQMNPPMYIIIGSLYQVQKYLTMANIQYSDQFLIINSRWMESLPQDVQKSIRKAAHDANVVNRIEVETQVSERVNFLVQNEMKAYYPNGKEMDEFRTIGQPGYLKWLQKKMSRDWIDSAMESAKEANNNAR